jgi:hypothetical protein
VPRYICTNRGHVENVAPLKVLKVCLKFNCRWLKINTSVLKKRGKNEKENRKESIRAKRNSY